MTMDISELIGSGGGDGGSYGSDANSSRSSPAKHFTDMPEFITITMIVYTLFTVVGSAGKKCHHKLHK